VVVLSGGTEERRESDGKEEKGSEPKGVRGEEFISSTGGDVSCKGVLFKGEGKRHMRADTSIISNSCPSGIQKRTEGGEREFK